MELVHRLLQELAREGVAILLSTHHLQEVARYAHRVGILGGGRLLDEVVLSGKEAYRLEAEPLEGPSPSSRPCPRWPRPGSRGGAWSLRGSRRPPSAPSWRRATG